MKKNQHLLKVALMVLTLTTLTACGTKGNPKTSEGNQVSVVEGTVTTPTPIGSNDSDGIQESKPTKDRAGNDIVLPDEVNKIISLAPSSTQILVDLGLGGKLIGVDSQSPLTTVVSPDILQFDMMAPDIEQLLSLEPDVIFVSSMTNYNGEDVLTAVRDAGIVVAEIPSSNSINDIKLDIRFIAEAVGLSSEGIIIVESMEKVINEIATIGQSITDKKTVLFEIAAAPYIYSFGQGVFLNEMIEIIGAKNVFASQNSWIAVTEESAIGANPDVILTSVNYIENPIDEIKQRAGWEYVTAVANDEVYYIDNNSSSSSNHNIVKALVEMAKAVYPQEYKNIE